MPQVPQHAPPNASSLSAAATPAAAHGTLPAGDRSRQRALFCLLVCVVALPASWLLFSQLERLWPTIAAMEGLLFMAATTLLGAAMAVGPLAAALGFLLAVWFGVESVYRPRRRPSPALDRFIIGAGLLVWFAPALSAIGIALQAVVRGRIHFVRPPRDYLLATDPIAFWQGVGFWLIMAALFAFLAWRYWRPRLLSGKPHGE
ncbi:hypothetical protein [Thauera sp. WH-1]|uniref:hypothetical protein n=1 Tax=Thauera sp. WH-1 TaxID=3398230 RepID=UPI0039FC835D